MQLVRTGCDVELHLERGPEPNMYLQMEHNIDHAPVKAKSANYSSRVVAARPNTSSRQTCISTKPNLHRQSWRVLSQTLFFIAMHLDQNVQVFPCYQPCCSRAVFVELFPLVSSSCHTLRGDGSCHSPWRLVDSLQLLLSSVPPPLRAMWEPFRGGGEKR